MKFLGIDPGDRWMGLAGLRNNGSAWEAAIAVVDLKQNTFYDNVKRVGDLIDEDTTKVICEDFRVRPQGHNRWAAGHTLRLIGALEFVAHDNYSTFAMIPPGDPDDLHGLVFGNNGLTNWRQRWPLWGDSKWKHGLSAWRVLALHLAHYYPDVREHLAPASYAVNRMGYDYGKAKWWRWPGAQLIAPRAILPLGVERTRRLLTRAESDNARSVGDSL